MPRSVTKWDYLSCISRLVAEGKTVAFPTFTFSFCKNGHCDQRTSPTETGILGQWVLQLDEAVRTSHPIYSFAIIGAMSQELVALPNSTTFGPDSVFSYFERNEARIIMLGCGWEFCTQYHRYEEEAKVPYRYYKLFQGTVNDRGGEHFAKAKMYVRDLDLNPTMNWDEVVLTVRKTSSYSSTRLWGGDIESVGCGEIAATCRSILSKDKWGLVAKGRVKENQYEQLKKAHTETPIKIAVLGSSNLELIKNHFSSAIEKHISDRHVECYTVPFGQLLQEICNPKSGLNEFDAGFSFFCDRIEDLIGATVIEANDLEATEAVFSEYIKAIKSYRANRSGWIIV
ncbi:AAC(3) family N-acetyltransferase, partial [Planctomycetota bacterium]